MCHNSCDESLKCCDDCQNTRNDNVWVLLRLQRTNEDMTKFTHRESYNFVVTETKHLSHVTSIEVDHTLNQKSGDGTIRERLFLKDSTDKLKTLLR